MNKKKLLEQLIEESYAGEQLDEAVVQKVSEQLDRRMLKQYIKLLKSKEQKKLIIVTTPKPLSQHDRERIAALFPEKRLVEHIDAKMINGIKVVNNDDEYEIDLNQTFRDIIRFVTND